MCVVIATNFVSYRQNCLFGYENKPLPYSPGIEKVGYQSKTYFKLSLLMLAREKLVEFQIFFQRQNSFNFGLLHIY